MSELRLIAFIVWTACSYRLWPLLATSMALFIPISSWIDVVGDAVRRFVHESRNLANADRIAEQHLY